MANFSMLGPRWYSSTVTWSFADPARRTDGGFSGAIGAAFAGAIQSAVQRWADVSGLKFQVVDDSAQPDIRIGWGMFAATSPTTIGETAYRYTIGGPFQPGVAIRLQDPSERPIFASASGTLTYAQSSATLYQVAVHEVGHALGLGHSTDPKSVLYPTVQATNQDVNASDIAGIQAIYKPAFVLQDGAGHSLASAGEPTDGTVNYLQAQYIHPGDADVSIGATRPDVFIKSGAGNDALAAQSGRNVLDGGRGSNFLVGGTGVDTYFIDGRGGQATWGTVVGFQPGEIITLWGFDPAVSRLTWAESEGAAGYTGRTLHADITGTGAASALVTIAGADAAAAGKWAITTGQVQAGPYLAIIFQA